MSDDLVNGWPCDDRRRDSGCRQPYGCHCREITSLRSVIEAQAAENERLRIAAGDAREKYATSYFRAVESRTAWRARAEQAERALDVANANHRQMSKQMADLGRALAEAQAHLAMRNSDLEEAARALAEAVEVLRPFAKAGLPFTLNGDCTMISADAVKAARQFVKEHGKP